VRIIGFSLFYNPSRKEWQRSIRHEGETGWSITYIPEQQAQRVLDGLDGAGQGVRALDRLATTLDAWAARVGR
jgi:hypothetical protein